MKAIRYFQALCVIASLSVNALYAESVTEKEKKRMKLNKKYDKLKLREKNDFVIDTSKDFLIEPPEKPAVGKFTVAKVPPTVKMRIIPDMEPEYFTDLTDDSEAYMTSWANWARVAECCS